jgi:hypothetical protein
MTPGKNPKTFIHQDYRGGSLQLNTSRMMMVMLHTYYKVVQIWPGIFVCKQVTVCPGHIWTTLYLICIKQISLQENNRL